MPKLWEIHKKIATAYYSINKNIY